MTLKGRTMKKDRGVYRRVASTSEVQLDGGRSNSGNQGRLLRISGP